MSFDVSWDIDKHREDHESDEHWQLRRNFIERWKDSYPEEKLICLARVFANMEFMGCRYPQEVMQEVARMSKEVNSKVTYNKNFTNISFDGYSTAQNTGPATPYAIKPIEQQADSTIDTTNYSDEVQYSSQNEYVWNPYSKEVMQGPVSVSTVLRTEQSQRFVRENTPNFGKGLTKFSRMDLASQSSLTLLTNSRIDTLRPYQEPRNALITYQNANNPVLYTPREQMINNSNTQDNPVVPQGSGLNATNWQSSQKLSQAYNIHDNHPESNAGIINYDDMTSAYNIMSNQEQCTKMNDNFGQQDQILTRFDGNHTRDYPEKNDWLQPGNSSTNPRNRFHGCYIDSGDNINPSPSNISAGISNIGTTNIDYAAANNDESKNIGAGVTSNQNPVGNDTKVMRDSVPIKQTGHNLAGVAKIPKEKRKRLIGKRRIKYKYWLSAGKSKKEAEALATIRLSRIPEYKELKKTLGSVKSFLKNKHISYQSKTVYNNGYYGHIKLNNMNKHPAQRNDNDPINTAVNVCNTATISNTPIISEPVTTSNIPTGLSNMAVSNYNFVERSRAIARNNTSNNATNSSNTGCCVRANSQFAENVYNPIVDTTSTMKVDSPKCQKDLWIEQRHSELISRMTLPNNSLIKELKAKTKTTMIKLAQKDKFREQITNIKDSNPQSSQIKMNTSVIEIPDDEDAKDKANERFEKEMKEKRRIWWLQQGKTEEDANYLSQRNMAIEDALEIMPNHEVLNKYLQDKNMPTVVNETQSVLKHEHLNTSGITDTPRVIENNENEQLNNAVNITNDNYSQNMETNYCIPGIQNQTETTAKYKIPKIPNTDYRKNTRHATNISPLTTNPNFTVILPKGSISKTTYYKIYVKDAKKEILKEECLQLQNVIAQCISDHHQVTFLRVNRLNGCAVVTCTDEYSRDWFDKEIPTLVPWEGAELIVLNEDDIPVYIYAWMYVPNVPEVDSLNPEDLLNKLHEQNENVGCDEWNVLTSQCKHEGQLCYVRFESKSAIVLHTMGYKLKWFGEQPIKIKVKQRSQETLTNLIKEKVKTTLDENHVIKPFSQNKSDINEEHTSSMVDQSRSTRRVKATAKCIPVFIHARIYVPVVPEINSLLNPKSLLRKLHERNKNVGCLKWKILSTQFMGEGQLCFVRFESKSAIVLHNSGYKLKWFGKQPIKVKIKKNSQDTINKLIKEKGKTHLDPLSQNEFTKISRRDRKKANSRLTNTENVLSNQKVKNLTPVVTIIDDDGREVKEENKYVDETTADMQVSGSGIGNEDNLKDIGMSSDKPMMGHYNQGIHPQPTSTHASEMSNRHDLASAFSMSANQDFPTDQANLVPSDAPSSAKNRSVNESQTDQTNRGDMRPNNESAVDHSSSERSKVITAYYWGIDTPRLLPGHRQVLKFKTDLWDSDDLRERINRIKRVNFARQNHKNVEDLDFQNIFTEDEEYSLEERVFAARKTRADQGQGILLESRIVGDNSLPNRNYDESGRVPYRDEDLSEQSRGYLNNEESSHRYFQEDFIRKAQPYSNNEITTSLDKNSQSYSKEDNTRGRVYDRDNSQQDYDEREESCQIQSWENTDMNEDLRYQENSPGRDWDEDNQGCSYNIEELEDWGPGYSQDTQSKSHGTRGPESRGYSQDTQSKSHGTRGPESRGYSQDTQSKSHGTRGPESRQREKHSTGRDNQEYSRKGKSNKVNEYFKIGHHQREMKDRSRSANSREFFLEERLGLKRGTDSRMLKPDYSGQEQRILEPKNRKRARARAYKRSQYNKH